MADNSSSKSSRQGQEDHSAHSTERQSLQDTDQASLDTTGNSVQSYGSIITTPARPAGPVHTDSRTPKKPTLPRKASSSYTTHTRKEFSVDDSQEEVDQDYRLAKSSAGSLRRQASTIRRKPMVVPALPRVESDEGEDELDTAENPKRVATTSDRPAASDDSEQTLRPGEEEEEAPAASEDDEVDDEDADDDEEDPEDFTLKDRQEAINETHPFGIRIWKPALYKKDRSVQATAEGDIHSAPGGYVSRWLSIFNVLWTLTFGLLLAGVALVGAILCAILGVLSGGSEYSAVLFHLAGYIFYPFGKFVRLEHDEAYLEEDEGEGRSISEYERWQTGDLEEGRLFFGPRRGLVGQRRDSIDSAEETDALLGRPSRNDRGAAAPDPAADININKTKKRPFGRGQWNFGRVVYFAFFYTILTPMLLLVSLVCWFFVFSIPMGRVTSLLLYHLRRHPLALSFHSDSQYSRQPDVHSSSILLCTYRAGGLKYWKYTVDGTNIFLINLLALVAFTIFDFFVLKETLEIHTGLTSSGFIFILSLLSIIPLAYFIGQAVASISAQSTMGVGATVNAFFSTVIEVFLYCVALQQGKAQLVEGSIIGSIFAGILLLPGISMCFGAIKRKTQRFNVKSAGVSSTMLMFAIIGSFGPTLFYQIYGSHELNCYQCTATGSSEDTDCRRCYFSQSPALNDNFFLTAVRPFIWFSATMLFLSYVIGLMFTLRTHASIIWNNEPEEKKFEKPDNRTTEQRPLDPHSAMTRHNTSTSVSPREIRDSQLYKRILGQSLKSAGPASGIVMPTAPMHEDHEDGHGAADDHGAGGHDAPNWSRTKSVVVLLSATVAYAIIAEILVDTVDAVLDNVDIDEKFVGITLFALVPNTTEFLNAISFAMNGNIALSMEIGSAYALQVMLLQVPALVLFTAIQSLRNIWPNPDDAAAHAFSLIFPQWDMVTVILGLFLMNYVVAEGKSNYFKGSMLVLSYLVVLVGFWFTGYNDAGILGINRFDTLALGNRVDGFKTIGQTTRGMAYRTEL
ncbi:hypothetical protein ANO11243_020960 [Dothideomycetidae sp. 11243]|nr:hypothetical protein ANO11243_020960 [fungal sp. No.11243]